MDDAGKANDGNGAEQPVHVCGHKVHNKPGPKPREKTDKRSRRIVARVSPAEWTVIENVAKSKRLTVSEFVRATALARPIPRASVAAIEVARANELLAMIIAELHALVDWAETCGEPAHVVAIVLGSIDTFEEHIAVLVRRWIRTRDKSGDGDLSSDSTRASADLNDRNEAA